jgi:hypothetical protein
VIGPGTKLSHFEILEKLGEGGMGAVYKALDLNLDRLVAIKLLSPGAASNPERQARFVQEAKAASSLNHPNIITVYEIDTAGEQPFIARIRGWQDARPPHPVPRHAARRRAALCRPDCRSVKRGARRRHQLIAT